MIMKKLLFILLVFSISFAGNAQKLNIHFKSGQVICYNVDEIDSLNFTLADSISNKDMTPPEITKDSITGSPIDCQVFQRGDIIPFNYIFNDNFELGSYNIEIHQNFDHHTHTSSSSVECEMDELKTSVNPWVFNNDYSIPKGKTVYAARQDIAIPNGIDVGDYHFVIRVTDKVGWQSMCAVAIKIR